MPPVGFEPTISAGERSQGSAVSIQFREMNIGDYAVPSEFNQLITILDSINEVSFSKPGRHTDFLDRLMVILLSHTG